MNDRTTFEIMGNILELTVELNSLSFYEKLEGNKKYLVLIEKMLKQIRADGHPGYPIRQYIEKIWGFDLDEGADAHQRCSEPDPED